MADPYLGEIRLFAGNYAPRNWAFCDGAIMSIAGYNALFSLLGTMYGGDGRTSFALPDFRGRAPVHTGQGPGLSFRVQGDRFGVENVTLSTDQIPAHSHNLQGSQSAATSAIPENHVFSKNLGMFYNSDDSPLGALKDERVGETGASLPHNNMAPFQVVSYIICIVGNYPSRS